jgi:hypothetical protein
MAKSIRFPFKPVAQQRPTNISPNHLMMRVCLVCVMRRRLLMVYVGV